MEKSREAFRTISEVAEWLDVPTHVLRFWESRFSQIKPVKRAGGRRYYRPSDMRVIGGVKTLLHDQGMTIRGVQKLFREQGMKHVSSYSPVLHGSDDIDDDEQVIEHQAEGAAIRGPSPAPAARSTREATPVPVVDAAPSDEDTSEAPVFSHARRPAPAGTASETPPAVQRVAEPEPEPEPQPEAPPAPTIPATPDVPEVDAADDDAAHPDKPGMPALLVTVRRTQFRGHGDTLSRAVKRLKDLRARLN